MNTDELIAQLSSELKPVSRHALGRRLAVGIALGAPVTALLVIAVLGVRPDFAEAARGYPFWMKWGYTLSLTVLALSMTAQLARPDGGRLRLLWLAAIPVLLLAGIGVLELTQAPRAAWPAMWLGRSWLVCPWIVLVLAMPIFVGLLWSFRKLAPTRLRAAGAAAGLSAGAFAATIYCLHCPEFSAIFVLTWYSLGILLAAGFGALVGPRLLRW